MKQREMLSGLRNHLPAFVFVLFLIQPLIDVLGYWQMQLGIPNTATILIRILLLVFCVLLGFILSDRKIIYIAVACVLAALSALHVVACRQCSYGYAEPIQDLINHVRIYYLPVMTLSLITYFRANKQAITAGLKGMTAAMLIIAFVQLLSTLTGTDPHTYVNQGIGTLGWFNVTSAQSAILSLLYPAALSFAWIRWPKKPVPLLLTALIGGASLYFLGTRLAFASLFAVLLGFAVCVLLIDRAAWKHAAAIALVACLFAALYPFSPMRQRNVDYDVRNEKLESQIIEKTSEMERAEGGSSVEKDENIEGIEDIYLHNGHAMMPGLLYRFGRDRVLKAYDYSLDPDVLRDVRRSKLMYCEMLMEDSGPLSRFFGISLKDLTVRFYDDEGVYHVDNFDPENDFHGIYYLLGAVGVVFYILILLACGLRSLFAVLRQPKKQLTPEMTGVAIMYAVGLIHAYFTASIFRLPNSSIFFALSLAALWVLPTIQREGAPNGILPEGK